MGSEVVEKWIKDNVQWTELPIDIQLLLGNSQREYEKRILDFSIKNQLKHKGNIGKKIIIFLFLEAAL